MTDAAKPNISCTALVSPPPYFDRYQCQNNGKHERGGHLLCGTHTKVYDKWVEEGRAEAMAKTYWWWKSND